MTNEMTAEEARTYFIKCNENLISVAKDENRYSYERQEIEAVCSRRAFEANKLAIKALEAQPSEDCISREEVQDLISRWLSDYLLDETREALETINYKVGDMPSVTPQRPKGKWIFREDMGHQYCCSECGCPKPFVNDYYYKKIIGCPYCLADMSGGGEDEASD